MAISLRLATSKRRIVFMRRGSKPKRANQGWTGPRNRFVGGMSAVSQYSRKLPRGQRYAPFAGSPQPPARNAKCSSHVRLRSPRTETMQARMHSAHLTQLGIGHAAAGHSADGKIARGG